MKLKPISKKTILKALNAQYNQEGTDKRIMKTNCGHPAGKSPPTPERAQPSRGHGQNILN